MTRRPAVVAVLAVLPVLAALLACAGWYHLSGRASVKTTDGDLEVMVGERGRAAMDAALRATVTKVGRCIGLGRDLTVWPHGTEVLSGNRIRVGGMAYRLGDVYEGGGGILQQDSGDFDLSAVHAPPGCPVTDALIVLAPQ